MAPLAGAVPPTRDPCYTRGMALVKVCGVTCLDDAQMCVDAGVDALGLNFWPGTKRRVDPEVARQIVLAHGDRVRMVGLFVDAATEDIEALRARVGFHCVQLHGDETPEQLAHFLPAAFKALRVKDGSIRDEAARYGGEHILLDAYVPGAVGGTGATFDWALAAELSRERRVVLAGGLTADNVAEAVRTVKPYAVDTASGVESAPGLKDESKVRAFVEAARRATARTP